LKKPHMKWMSAFPPFLSSQRFTRQRCKIDLKLTVRLLLQIILQNTLLKYLQFVAEHSVLGQFGEYAFSQQRNFVSSKDRDCSSARSIHVSISYSCLVAFMLIGWFVSM
jgi:hypothetical protein